MDINVCIGSLSSSNYKNPAFQQPLKANHIHSKEINHSPLNARKTPSKPLASRRIHALLKKYANRLGKAKRIVIFFQNAVVFIKDHTFNSIQFGKEYKDGIPTDELKHFINPQVVVVRGIKINPFHHAIIAFHDPSEKCEKYRFMHINYLSRRPEFMNEEQFKQYLASEGGEITRVYNHNHSKTVYSYDNGGGVPKIDEMHNYLQQVAAKKWLWKGPRHNCLSLYLKILQAAGYDMNQMNCLLHLPLPFASRMIKKTTIT